MPSGNSLGQLVVLVEQLRERQTLKGRIENPCSSDYALITELIEVLNQGSQSIEGLGPQLLEGTIADLKRWLQHGLDQIPFFDNTLRAFKHPKPGGAFFLLAVMRATNGPPPEGLRLEMVTGVRSETPYLSTASQHTQGYVAPFQCIKLGTATSGFNRGNCIVLFPESIASSCKIEKQSFAFFFFNKFKSIYVNQTLPEVQRLFDISKPLLTGSFKSFELSDADTYDARCLWGYYHDYAHHTGPRPLNRNLYLKMNWYVGLLEEIKCDLITIRLVEKFKPPFWQEIIEFVLLDRMFRYPIGSEKNLTFDGGTGILLFEILVQNGVLCTDKRERLHFKNELLVSQLEAIVAEIEALERLGDEQYKEAAMSYVQGHLGRPTEKFCRFNFSTTQYAMRVATR